MATQVQRRRGTASEHNTFTGAAGEVTVNTTNDSVHVHDGATAGGFEAMRADADNAQNDVITNDMLSLNANDGEIKKAINADNAAPIFAVRAHINFSGYAMTIHGSGNVSSIVDRGTGLYTVNFQTDMPNTEYTAAGMHNSWGPSDQGGRSLSLESLGGSDMNGNAGKFVGSVDLIVGREGGEENDAEDINLIIVT